MKKQEEGFILFMTLLIITIISLLTLTLMQHILLFYKVINKQEVVHQSFYQLEKIVLQLAHSSKMLRSKQCITQGDSANQIMHYLHQQKGCALVNDSLHYQYLIEDLGEFPCLVAYNKGQKHASAHRRISIVQIDEGVPMAFLQIRVIYLGHAINCFHKEHVVSLGVSSWRYLPEI